MDESADALFGLAEKAFGAGEPVEAKRLTGQLLARFPNHLGGWLLAGVLAVGSGDLESAVRWLEALVRSHPDAFDGLVWLSIAKAGLGETQTAVDLANQAIAIQSDHPQGHYQLAKCLMGLATFEEASEQFAQAIALGFSEPNVLHDRALALLAAASQKAADGDLGQAELFALRSIAQFPTAAAWTQLGLWQQVAGRGAEAVESLQKSIALEPRQGAAYYYLLQGRRLQPGDLPLLEQMEALIEEANLPDRDLELLSYAAGKGREELGDYPKAINHYDTANRLVVRHHPELRQFDAQQFVGGYDAVIAAMPGPLESAGPADETPVFVIGMIRSGTTLLEQILSSHPEVAAVGESPFWVDHVAEAFAMEPATLARLGESYLENLPVAKRVVDKMPANASLAGLIHRALPKARFIHIRRHPADNCLSIYTTRFEQPPIYAGIREHIELAYVQHMRAMEHWAGLLPPDRFIAVDYEALVADTECMARRLIAFCGLDWDKSCLRPQENLRSVHTPSLWRVRQPVDATSVARWRHLEGWGDQKTGLANVPARKNT